MKLIVQVPCYNEERTLPQTLADLPKELPGFELIEYLVIDDGSSDRTAEVALECGAHHVLRLGSNRGLGTAFKMGLDYALGLGADVVVNTDGDNQYRGEDIRLLVEPIFSGRADIVIGCRPILSHPEFGVFKKGLQIFGSAVLRKIAKTEVRDAPSGFRAFNREAILRLFLNTRFSHCIETLIQAGNNGLRVGSVEVGVNPKTRESRLFRSIPEYLWKTGTTILSMMILYRPSRLFVSLAILFFSFAFALGVRFIYLVYIIGNPDPTRTYLPSLVLLAVMAMTGSIMLVVGILAELSRGQRRLSEEILYQARLSNLNKH